MEGNDAADGEENWGEVDLEGIEVTHVGDIEETEHADHAVGEDDQGVAHVLVAHLDARQREDQLGEDHSDRSDGFFRLHDRLVEHIELPAIAEHLVANLSLQDSLWEPVVVFLWHLVLAQWRIGLVARLVLELNFLDIEDLLENAHTNDGIECVNGAEHEEHGLHVNVCEGEDRDGHPDFVTLSLKNSFH